MKSVFLDAEGIDDCDLEMLKSVCDQLEIYSFSTPEEITERLAGAEIVITNKARIGRTEMAANPGMKLICVVATGTDVIDLQAATDMGITVCNCQAYGTDSVVQHVFASILALQTSLIQYHQAVQQGRWQKASQFCFLDYPISELQGKTLGIVGFGTLGKGVAKIAEAFGMKVVVAARPGTADSTRPSLEELLPQLDILTLHCPLNDATRGLIGEKEFTRMKPTAFLVNAARGGIVDEVALTNALKEGMIAGAAMDVLSVEPPQSSNPLLETGLPNLIVTPHIAWASKEARQRIVDQTVENIESWKKGGKLRVVNG